MFNHGGYFYFLSRQDHCFFLKTNQRNSHSVENHLHLMIFKSMLRATNEKKYKNNK